MATAAGAPETAIKTTLERELKLGAGPRFRLPRLPGETLPPRTVTDIYFDTEDHRLATGGVTLRRRIESSQSRWQVKLPHGAARLELELPAGARPSGRGRGGAPSGVRSTAPPAPLVDLVTAWTRGAALSPVATLRSRRRGMLVRDVRGPVAEVMVDAVHVLDGARPLKRFREIEVELTGGDEADLERIGQALRAAGATDGDGRPKLLRALGVQPAPLPAPAPAQASAVERLRAMIDAQRYHLVVHDPTTRLGHDPEALHQMRVACRRVRALLREAGPMLVTEWSEPLRDEMAWLADELGRVRDLDVLRRDLADEIARLDPADAQGAARLLRALEADREQRRAALLAALRSERYLALLAALDDAARRPAIADPDVSLDAVACDAWKRLRKAARALGDQPSDQALHEVRIKAKRARYAAELVAPTRGKPVERFVDRVKALQELLGEYQDAVVAQHCLRALAARAHGGPVAFTAGRLFERQIARRAQILGQLPKRWRKLAKRGSKAWR